MSTTTKEKPISSKEGEEVRYSWSPSLWVPPDERVESTGQFFSDGERLYFGVVCNVEVV